MQPVAPARNDTKARRWKVPPMSAATRDGRGLPRPSDSPPKRQNNRRVPARPRARHDVKKVIKWTPRARNNKANKDDHPSPFSEAAMTSLQSSPADPQGPAGSAFAGGTMRARHPHERHDFFQQTRCGHASPPLSPSVRNALKILKPATVMTAAAPIAPYNPLLRGLLDS
jgi:hypothetical protein